MACEKDIEDGLKYLVKTLKTEPEIKVINFMVPTEDFGNVFLYNVPKLFRQHKIPPQPNLELNFIVANNKL